MTKIFAVGVQLLSRLNRRALGIVASLLAAAGFMSCWHFFREPVETPPELPIVQNGISLSLVPQSFAPGTAHVAARRDDFLLRSKHVGVTVGSDGSSAQRRARAGALLDLAASDFSADRLEEFRTVLWQHGKAVPLRTLGIRPDRGQPKLLIVQSSTDGRFEVTTTVELAAGEPRVLLESSVKNTSGSRLDRVQLGDRVSWPGTLTFAPRVGFVTEPGHREVTWIAREGARLSYALAFHDGPLDVDFLFDRVGSSHSIALSRASDLGPGQTLRHSRSLVVSARGLAGVGALAMRALGKKLTRVSGQVDPPPRWGVVEARQLDNKPIIETTLPRNGRFQLWLPAGEYDLVLRAPGGRDEERIQVAAEELEVRLLAPMPGTLRYAVLDDAGNPSPARLSIRGVAPTNNPDFGARQLASGVRNVAYSTTGSGVLELPPGRYRVMVTRGFEYGIFDQEVEVTRDAGASVRVRLERVVDTSGWISGDFHVHAAPSFDSSVELPDRVASLIAEGVEFAVATDHNHVTDYSDTIQRDKLGDLLASSPGIEVTTKTWGHFIAFPYETTEDPPPYESVSPSEIFAVIRERAPTSLIQINHPRMAPIAYFAKLAYGADVARGRGDARGSELVEVPEGFSFDFDTIEVINGFELKKPDAMIANVRDWFALLNVGFRHTAVGNSDSHSLVHQWAGYPRTFVRVSDDRPDHVTPAEIASALLQGRAQISNGIFLEVRANDNAQIGDRVTASDGVVNLNVVARAAPWVDVNLAELWVNGNRIAETKRTAARRESNRVQWQQRITLDKDSWLVVVARGAVDLSESYPGGRGLPFAIANPIFVDVDSDGEFTAPLAGDESDQEQDDDEVPAATPAPRDVDAGAEPGDSVPP